eukprot:TRINITY_DN30578_c0_g4_i1.p2 TRINITY_DN30578_c0_g4~~TRINITY_DN30578_c0_g4_i1.p2  ORF type:complete len:355 (+),score=143.53 TRINITY_DN30578_c0_g4_i1:180-1244(+)
MATTSTATTTGDEDVVVMVLAKRLARRISNTTTRSATGDVPQRERVKWKDGDKDDAMSKQCVDGGEFKGNKAEKQDKQEEKMTSKDKKGDNNEDKGYGKAKRKKAHKAVMKNKTMNAMKAAMALLVSACDEMAAATKRVTKAAMKVMKAEEMKTMQRDMKKAATQNDKVHGDDFVGDLEGNGANGLMYGVNGDDFEKTSTKDELEITSESKDVAEGSDVNCVIHGSNGEVAAWRNIEKMTICEDRGNKEDYRDREEGQDDFSVDGFVGDVGGKAKVDDDVQGMSIDGDTPSKDDVDGKMNDDSEIKDVMMMLMKYPKTGEEKRRIRAANDKLKKEDIEAWRQRRRAWLAATTTR